GVPAGNPELTLTLALTPRQHALAQPQRLRRHLEQLIVLHPLERPLDLELARRREHGVLVLARGADVGELLRAHDVHVEVAAPAVLADDHALVDFYSRAHEQRRPLLDAEQAVRGGLAGLGRHDRADAAARDLACPRLVAADGAVQHALAARIGE